MDHSSPDGRLINSPGPAGIVSMGSVLSASSESLSTGRRLTLSGLVCVCIVVPKPHNHHASMLKSDSWVKDCH